MASKQEIKTSEARIIMYLKSVQVSLTYISAISLKLDMDYRYVIQILNNMRNKGWVEKTRGHGRTYYRLLEAAPIIQAGERLLSSK